MLPPRKPPALNPAARVGFRQGLAAGAGFPRAEKARVAMAANPRMPRGGGMNTTMPVGPTPRDMRLMSEGGKACKGKKGKKK